MIDIKVIAKNLVKEAVESTVNNQVKEGRPASGNTVLTRDASLGSNADQLFLRYGFRPYDKRTDELDALEQQIIKISSKLSDEELDQIAQDPNSELYQLVDKYNRLERQKNGLAAIMDKYQQEYEDNDHIVSPETRKALRNWNPEEADRYDTTTAQRAMEKAKKLYQKRGINSLNDFGIDGINSIKQPEQSR